MGIKQTVRSLVRKEIGEGPNYSYTGFITILCAYAETVKKLHRTKEAAIKYRENGIIPTWAVNKLEKCELSVRVYEKYVRCWRDYDYVPIDVYVRATETVEKYLKDNF